jgi:preprotein translocase subunit SecD
MKTIYYLLITFLIITLDTSTSGSREASKHTILIQASDKNIPTELLSQSAKIISDRLKDFSNSQPEVSVNQQKKQIKVVFSGDQDLKTIENLVVHKGEIEFYETYDHDGIVELLSGYNHLFTLLTKSEIDNGGTKIGCTTASGMANVNAYLNQLSLGRKCRFVWSQDFDKPNVCLYALKITGDKGSVITGNEIESAKYDQDRIKIKLRPQAAGVWAEATRRNLNKVIAIVLDDNVISAPTVKSSIESGELEISGSYSKTEAGYIASILNNGALPAEFVIVR